MTNFAGFSMLFLLSVFNCRVLSTKGFYTTASFAKRFSCTFTSRNPTRMMSQSNRMSTTSEDVSSDGGAEGSSLRVLCEVTKRACDILTPMIVSIYNSIQASDANGQKSKVKVDDSAFTIADGVVQHLLTKELL
eukprot:9434051-Ditylum_brightwellii.AAC.1